MATTPGTYFTGYYRIAQDNQTNENLNYYVTKFEKKYLVDLFGKELYDLFIADLSNGVPQSTRFTTVYNALSYDPYGSSAVFIPIDAAYTNWADQYKGYVKPPTESEGISTMLKGFVFYHFVGDMDMVAGQTGVVTNKDENSDTNSKRTLEFIESKYNEAVNSFKVIRNYILANPTTYPEYAGVDKDYNYWGGAL